LTKQRLKSDCIAKKEALNWCSLAMAWSYIQSVLRLVLTKIYKTSTLEDRTGTEGTHFESRQHIVDIFVFPPFLQTNPRIVFETATTAAFQVYTYSLFMVSINEQLVSSDKAPDLYTGGTRFEPWPRHRLFSGFSWFPFVRPVKCQDSALN
jgi:hypothetical protein